MPTYHPPASVPTECTIIFLDRNAEQPRPPSLVLSRARLSWLLLCGDATMPCRRRASQIVHDRVSAMDFSCEPTSLDNHGWDGIGRDAVLRRIHDKCARHPSQTVEQEARSRSLQNMVARWSRIGSGSASAWKSWVVCANML